MGRSARHVDITSMDSLGARHLAARIRAGVRIGMVIELQQDVASEGVGEVLRAGDRGVVSEISLEGVHVWWERGFSRTIDPDQALYRLAS